MGGISGGAAIGGVAGVQVQNGGPGVCGTDGGSGDFGGGDGQVRRLARDMDRAGDGAGDDDFGHLSLPYHLGMGAGDAPDRGGREESKQA